MSELSDIHPVTAQAIKQALCLDALYFKRLSEVSAAGSYRVGVEMGTARPKPSRSKPPSQPATS